MTASTRSRYSRARSAVMSLDGPCAARFRMTVIPSIARTLSFEIRPWCAASLASWRTPIGRDGARLASTSISLTRRSTRAWASITAAPGALTATSASSTDKPSAMGADCLGIGSTSASVSASFRSKSSISIGPAFRRWRREPSTSRSWRRKTRDPTTAAVGHERDSTSEETNSIQPMRPTVPGSPAAAWDLLPATIHVYRSTVKSTGQSCSCAIGAASGWAMRCGDTRRTAAARALL